MFTHFIVLSSSYSTGTRIALHLPFENGIDERMVEDVLKRINSVEGTPPLIAVHVKQTDSAGWESVVASDSYFKDVRVIETADLFVDLIRLDRTFEGSDVARYILSQIPCSLERLELLTCLSYAVYSHSTGRGLFEDSFAISSGEISIGSVRRRFYGFEESESIPWDSDGMAVRSRLMFADDGLGKVMAIDRTVRMYGGLTDGELRDLVGMIAPEDTPS